MVSVYCNMNHVCYSTQSEQYVQFSDVVLDELGQLKPVLRLISSISGLTSVLKPRRILQKNWRHKFDARFCSVCHTIWCQIFTGAGFWSQREYCSISVLKTGMNGLL